MPAAFAAQIIGGFDLQATFGAPTAGVTFTAMGPHSSSTTQGTVNGLNFTLATLFATATDFSGGNMSATVGMNLTAGPDTSFSGAYARAITGVVRVTNSNATQTNFTFTEDWTYSMQAIGPTSASLQYIAQLQFFDTATQNWVPRQSGSNTVMTGQSDTACQIQCLGSPGNIAIAGNTSTDYRVFLELAGGGQQIGGEPPPPSSVPEPSSLVLLGAGIAALAFRRC